MSQILQIYLCKFSWTEMICVKKLTFCNSECVLLNIVDIELKTLAFEWIDNRDYGFRHKLLKLKRGWILTILTGSTLAIGLLHNNHHHHHHHRHPCNRSPAWKINAITNIIFIVLFSQLFVTVTVLLWTLRPMSLPLPPSLLSSSLQQCI